MNPSVSLAWLALASSALAGIRTRGQEPAPPPAPEVVDLFRAADEPSTFETPDGLDPAEAPAVLDDEWLELEDEDALAILGEQDPEELEERRERAQAEREARRERMQALREALEEQREALEENRRALEESQREWAESLRAHRELSRELAEQSAAETRAQVERARAPRARRSAGRFVTPGADFEVLRFGEFDAPSASPQEFRFGQVAPVAPPQPPEPAAACEEAREPAAPCAPAAPGVARAPRARGAIVLDREGLAKLAEEARSAARAGVRAQRLGEGHGVEVWTYGEPVAAQVDADAIQRSVEGWRALAREHAAAAGAYHLDGETLRPLGELAELHGDLGIDVDELRREVAVARDSLLAARGDHPELGGVRGESVSADTMQELSALIREMSEEVRGLRDDLRGLRDDLRRERDADR